MAKLKIQDIVMVNEYCDLEHHNAGIGEIVAIDNEHDWVGYNYKVQLFKDGGFLWFKSCELTKLGTTLLEIEFRNDYIGNESVYINGSCEGYWRRKNKYLWLSGREYSAKSKADIKRRLKKKTKTVEYWTLED